MQFFLWSNAKVVIGTVYSYIRTPQFNELFKTLFSLISKVDILKILFTLFI